MNLDTPERLKAIVKAHQWGGQTLYMRKLSVAEWRRLVKLRTEMVKDETDEKGGFTWGAIALSKQLCSESGELIYDTDEWRTQFESKLSPDEMGELLTEAHTWSGVWGRKDEEQKKS